MITGRGYGLDYESVSFPTSDGLTLRGWFIPASQPACHLNRSGQGEMARDTCATILVGHGYPFDRAKTSFGMRSSCIPAFICSYLIFRYFGESEGAYTTAGLLETRDVQAAIDYVKSRSDVNPERIGAMGFSMSASAFILTRHPDVKAIVADSPYATLESGYRPAIFLPAGLHEMATRRMTKFYAWLFLGLRVRARTSRRRAGSQYPLADHSRGCRFADSS